MKQTTLDKMSQERRREMMIIQSVLTSTCELFDIPETIVISKCRLRPLVTLRQYIYLYCSNSLKHVSYADMGFIAAHDHSTVMHNINTAKALMLTDKNYRKKYKELEDYLNRNVFNIYNHPYQSGFKEEVYGQSEIIAQREYRADAMPIFAGWGTTDETDDRILQTESRIHS